MPSGDPTWLGAIQRQGIENGLGCHNLGCSWPGTLCARRRTFQGSSSHLAWPLTLVSTIPPQCGQGSKVMDVLQQCVKRWADAAAQVKEQQQAVVAVSVLCVVALTLRRRQTGFRVLDGVVDRLEDMHESSLDDVQQRCLEQAPQGTPHTPQPWSWNAGAWSWVQGDLTPELKAARLPSQGSWWAKVRL